MWRCGTAYEVVTRSLYSVAQRICSCTDFTICTALNWLPIQVTGYCVTAYPSMQLYTPAFIDYDDLKWHLNVDSICSEACHLINFLKGLHSSGIKTPTRHENAIKNDVVTTMYHQWYYEVVTTCSHSVHPGHTSSRFLLSVKQHYFCVNYVTSDMKCHVKLSWQTTFYSFRL